MSPDSKKKIKLIGEMFAALHPEHLCIINVGCVANDPKRPGEPLVWIASVKVDTPVRVVSHVSGDAPGPDEAIDQLVRSVREAYMTQAETVPRVLASLAETK